MPSFQVTTCQPAPTKCILEFSFIEEYAVKAFVFQIAFPTLFDSFLILLTGSMIAFLSTSLIIDSGLVPTYSYRQYFSIKMQSLTLIYPLPPSDLFMCRLSTFPFLWNTYMTWSAALRFSCPALRISLSSSTPLF